MVQEFLDHTTPSARSKEASLLFLDVAATPPPAEEGSRLLQLSKRGIRKVPSHALLVVAISNTVDRADNGRVLWLTSMRLRNWAMC